MIIFSALPLWGSKFIRMLLEFPTMFFGRCTGLVQGRAFQVRLANPIGSLCNLPGDKLEPFRLCQWSANLYIYPLSLSSSSSPPIPYPKRALNHSVKSHACFDDSPSLLCLERFENGD